MSEPRARYSPALVLAGILGASFLLVAGLPLSVYLYQKNSREAFHSMASVPPGTRGSEIRRDFSRFPSVWCETEAAFRAAREDYVSSRSRIPPPHTGPTAFYSHFDDEFVNVFYFDASEQLVRTVKAYRLGREWMVR